MTITDPPNGRKFGTRFSHSRVVSFECKSGYELVGDRALRCINGRWNSSVPVCKAMLCSKPSIPSNSYIIHPRSNQLNYIHGTNVFLACRDGHYLEGSPIMVCNQTMWSKREFSCIASCPALSSVKNGIITHLTLKGGGEVEIKCLSPYTLVGSPKLSCINGRWNGIKPSCKASCDDPGLIVHGRKTGNDFSHGQIVTYGCRPGYSLEGNSQLTCNNGNWDSDRPQCKERCQDPGKPLNGWRLGNNYSNGGTVQFICKYGTFDLVGASRITCIEGEWSYPKPSCEARCGDPGKPDNGIKEGDDYRSRASVTFRCNPPLELIGSRVISCQDGKWSDSRPTCSTSCDDPGLIAHGRKTGNDFSHGHIVTYECTAPGYSLVGNPRLTCNNGNWDSDRPKCKGCGRGLGIPLGMTSGDIPDKSIKASSEIVEYPAHQGRLGGDSYWCSREERISYIQIHLPRKYKITATGIQFKSNYNIRAIILKVQVSNQWREFYLEKPSYSEGVKRILPHQPFIAQSLRIRVIKNGPISICLRAEVYGCEIPRGCIMRGSAVLAKHSSGYQKGIVGNIYPSVNFFEVFKFHSVISRISVMKRTYVILDEKPSADELSNGTLVVGKDVNPPGLIREGILVQRGDLLCTIKTNDEKWFSDVNDVRVVKESYFCPP